ncbi:MAG: hypothetical protein JHC93_04160 [Parachlamydiales bacterium]|nr:hypothetical protein [Parachlamydiales bacterium]
MSGTVLDIAKSQFTPSTVISSSSQSGSIMSRTTRVLHNHNLAQTFAVVEIVASLVVIVLGIGTVGFGGNGLMGYSLVFTGFASLVGGSFTLYKIRSLRYLQNQQEQITQLTSENETYAILNTQNQKQIEDYKNENSEYKKLNLENAGKILELSTQVFNFEKLNESLSTTNDELGVEVTNLRSEVNKLTDIEKSLQSENDKLQKTRIELNSEIDNLNTKFEKTLKEKTDELNHVSLELSKTSKELLKMSVTADAFKVQVENLHQENIKSIETIQRFEEQVSSLEKIKNDLETNKINLQSEISNLEKNNNKTKAEMDASLKKLNDTEKALRQSSEQIKRFNNIIRDLSEQVTKQTVESINTLTSSVDLKIQDFATRANELAQTQTAVTKLEHEIFMHAINERIDELKSYRDIISKETLNLQKQVDEMKALSSSIGEDRQDIHNTNESMKQQVEKLTNQILKMGDVFNRMLEKDNETTMKVVTQICSPKTVQKIQKHGKIMSFDDLLLEISPNPSRRASFMEIEEGSPVKRNSLEPGAARRPSGVYEVAQIPPQRRGSITPQKQRSFSSLTEDANKPPTLTLSPVLTRKHQRTTSNTLDPRSSNLEPIRKNNSENLEKKISDA